MKKCQTLSPLQKASDTFLVLVAAVAIAQVVAPLRAWAMEPTPGYTEIQQAFLREEFPLVATLAQAFLDQHPGVSEIPRVSLWLALSLDRLQRTGEALAAIDRVKGRLPAADPFWPEVLFWEGEVSRKAFQMRRAQDAYQRLLARHPNSSWASQAQMGLALAFLHQEDLESAIANFHEVGLRQDGTPVALEALMLEGLCHLRLRRFSEATAILEPLLARIEEPAMAAQAAFYLGESHSGLGRFDEAARAYRRAIAAASGSRWGRLSEFGLGWASYQTERWEQGVEAFDRYLANPHVEHKTEALFAQGSCFLKLGREEEALQRFEHVVSRDPGHALAVQSTLLLADAYRRQERFSLAKELLNGLLRRRLEPAVRSEVQLRLAVLALAQGQADQAKTLFSLVAGSDDPSVRQAALSGLGDVHMFLGELLEAKRAYEQAIPLGGAPQADYASYQAGRIALQLGSLDEAVAVFQRLSAHPEAPLADDARLALIIAHLNRREEPSARSLIETIRREQPGSLTAARASYYDALLALGTDDEMAARRLCTEAIAKAPGTDEAFEARLLLIDLSTQELSPGQAIQRLQRLFTTERLPRVHRAKLAKRIGDLARNESSYAEAIRWYDVASALSPALSGEGLYRIASCYEEAGDFELAVHRYRLIAQPPWRVRGALAAAKLLERQDRLAEAEAVYRSLADEPIPEAQLIQERLNALQAAGEESGW
jgi:tetratricopeptide (TPR) repeat protein